MISDHAKKSIEYLLTKALEGSFNVGDRKPVVMPIQTMNALSDMRVVALTVSSYTFRLMVMIHFTTDMDTRKCLSGPTDAENDTAISISELCDAISEKGNLCCGILSRELAEFFPHVGMSTPNYLDQQSISYLSILQSDYIEYFHMQLSDDVSFYVTLCTCTYEDMDFMVETEKEVEETGELELF